MSLANGFPEEIHEKLGYYVYRLVNPSSDKTFYVGKGKGNRAFQHARAVENSQQKELEREVAEEELTSNDPPVDAGSGIDDVDLDLKFKEIQEIYNAGDEPKILIHRHGMDEQTAYEVESALIDAYPDLTNKIAGHGASSFGCMSAQEICDLYQAEVADFGNDKVLMLKIGSSDTDMSVYEAVHFAWRVSKRKAEQADYVLAVCKGLIVGVFVAEKWLPATAEYFPGHDPAQGRFGFYGREADDAIQKRYARKRVPDAFRNDRSSNPVRYSYDSV